MNRRETPDSSLFVSVGYDSEDEILEVIFRRTGETVEYMNVPEVKGRAMMEAESPGSYYNREIRGKYARGVTHG